MHKCTAQYKEEKIRDTCVTGPRQDQTTYDLMYVCSGEAINLSRQRGLVANILHCLFHYSRYVVQNYVRRAKEALENTAICPPVSWLRENGNAMYVAACLHFGII